MTTYLSTDAGALIDGRYRLSALIAQGPHAEVWHARDERLARFVALRRFRPGATDAGHEHAQIPLLARLNHPGLLTVLDAGVEPDAGVGRRAFLITELMTAPTLATELANRRIAPDEIARIGTQVAAALAYAHSCRVVHSRISAANVFVTATQAAAARLADLGIAALLAEVGPHGHADTEAAGLTQDVQDLACVLLGGLDFAGRRQSSENRELRRVLVEAAATAPPALELSARLSPFTVAVRPTQRVEATRSRTLRRGARRLSKAAAA